MTVGRRPEEFERSRQCAKTGLRLIPTHERQAVRIARPSYGPMNPPLREPAPSNVGSWGRWDVPNGRTIYAADSEDIAYRELLAYLAPAVGLRTTLSQVFVEEDGPSDPRTVLEAIGSEWEDLFSISPTKIVQGWREGRRRYTLGLPDTGWAVLIEHGDSVEALNRGMAQDIAARGTKRLDRSHLCGETRSLTMAVAQWVRAQVLDDGSLAHGICYPSKHADEGTCWALWLRRVDDGADPTTEPTKVLATDTIAGAHHNPALKKAADALGLVML